ncbi:MAG: aldehyde ferredoxin oxidoreductase N-terminal domain-containing protein [Desulfomonilaceae bacterium]
MDYLSSNRILYVDLGTGNVSHEDISDELVEAKVGGVGINTYLYERNRDNHPIILGTGLLTGTLFPGAALGIVSGESPRTGGLAHAPITLKAGAELKYSGFDYVVITGKSEKPVFLWLHDGVADVHDASPLWGRDVWETTDAIRKEMGDDLIQVLAIGKAGESGTELGQICINYWASGDYWGFGKLFGDSNLKGIAVRGMGLLEVADPEGFVDQCFDVFGRIKSAAYADKQGIGDILEGMGEKEVSEWLGPIVHRHSACYNTPYATNTFVFLDDDPKLLTESIHPEPGFLITDPCALLILKRLQITAREAAAFLKACAKNGADAWAAASLCEKSGQGNLSDVLQQIGELKGPLPPQEEGRFSPWCPQHPLFSTAETTDSKKNREWWTRRQALAYLFGIHPIFATMSPEISEDILIDVYNKGTGLELGLSDLNAVVEYVCG